ncbi:hypothetical protein [Natronosalvus caseinilyticus]|uniref:hypothetical protein n=1 Tax=Natronosalvus caseinilyticus TaxID=2953747 RepID=UPI0028A6425E|nr:hypothetical protein [Natronosalvus caseinilyticus]
MSTDASTAHANAPEHEDPSNDEIEGLSAPMHRNDDGDALALSIVLSPDQIAALDIGDSVDTVRPVVRNGSIHIEPA